MEQDVKRIIGHIGEKYGTDTASARTFLHKFVCGGNCNWFKSKGPPERFELDLTAQQKEEIQEIVNSVMEGVSKDQARKDIHAVLC